PALGPGDGQRLSDFFRFFHEPSQRTLSLTPAMYVRASAIRGGHRYPAIPPAQPKRYGLADALHLAAALESGCDVFLTNDSQLAAFPDITVEEFRDRDGGRLFNRNPSAMQFLRNPPRRI